MQFTACLLAFNCNRGGIACYMLRKEAARARPVKDQEGRFVVTVSKHKTMKTYGDAEVVLHEEDHAILQKVLKLRDSLAASPPFQGETLIIDLDGQDLRHLYTNIQTWAAKRGITGKFNSTIMRRTVTSLAFEHHDAETFVKVGRQQTHSTSMAMKMYTAAKGRTKAGVNFSATENVKANKIICEEAAQNIRDWFGSSVYKPFPGREDCCAILRERTTKKKYLDVFDLTESWHHKLQQVWERHIGKIMLDLYLPRVHDEDFDVQELEDVIKKTVLAKHRKAFFAELAKEQEKKKM